MARNDGVTVAFLTKLNPTYIRRDMVNIWALAESIATIDMQYPIVTTSDYQIIDGARRLEAAKFLRRETVPVIATDDLETIQRYMTMAKSAPRGTGNNPLTPIPLSWMENIELLETHFRPRLVKRRVERINETKKRGGGKASSDYSEEYKKRAAALGVGPYDVQALMNLGAVIAHWEEKEPGLGGKRVVEFIEGCERKGWTPGTALIRARRHGGYGDAPAETVFTKREQAQMIEATASVLRTLGADLDRTFVAVNAEFTPDEVAQMVKTLDLAQAGFRKAMRVMRKFTTEEKEQS